MHVLSRRTVAGSVRPSPHAARALRLRAEQSRGRFKRLVVFPAQYGSSDPEETGPLPAREFATPWSARVLAGTMNRTPESGLNMLSPLARM